MALEMDSQRGTDSTVEVDVKLWLTKDKDELVPDGDERAAFLYCTPGKRVPRDEAEQFGILGAPKSAASEADERGAEQEADVQEPEAAVDEAAEADQEADAADEAESKAQKAPPNKSRSRRGQK